MENRKSQIWFVDFVIGIFLFTILLIWYYSYTSSLSKGGSIVMQDLIADAESISSSVLLPGFPDDWDNTTVRSIGITSDNQKINRTKLVNFGMLPYNRTRNLLGTVYDYFIFFTAENGTPVNAEGICGIGNPEVNSTYDVKAAYYYSDEADAFIKDFMENEMHADIYKRGLAGSDLPDLVNNLNNYEFVAMEHPDMSGSDHGNYQDDLEDYVAEGNFLILSGQTFSPDDAEMLGVKFRKQFGASSQYLNATIIEEDEFLTFELNQNITFTQVYYVLNESIAAKNFTRIARFVNPIIDDPDENNAVSRWNYGSGRVFFFSDFDATYFKGNFIYIVENSAAKWANLRCTQANLTNTQYKNLIRIERFLIYDSKPGKMVFYLWSNI